MIKNVETETTLVVGQDGRYLQKLNQPIPVRLEMKEELATDTFVYRMAFDDEHADKALGHLTCQYLQFEIEIEGQKIQRYYHPMSKVTD